jgi:RHH-type transcriptional regulator, proline utilization regulon repressor / proline dehydrogenase / delta 1-pyrroline-5-carboxylate dehydrogenase
MLFEKPIAEPNPLRAAITRAYRMDETECVNNLVQEATLPSSALDHIARTARRLVQEVRKQRLNKGGLDAFLYQYDLSSSEGITLMCLAEALLRVPDTATIDNLLRDKITAANWAAHIGQSESLFVNAATWGLLLTGKILSNDETAAGRMRGSFKQLLERAGIPVIRKAVKQAMGLLGRQFVMGETIEDALKRAQEKEKQGYRFSYDMLGEAAITAADAERYFQSYQHAITEIGKVAKDRDVTKNPGISIKLSALHPRYEFAKHERVLAEVTPRLRTLALQAKAVNIGLTVDAEEAERLDLSLDIIEQVFCDPALDGWEGFGLAVQSYQKRAWYVLDWLIDLSHKQKKRWMVRLIKGAYWDTEIKIAQVKGLSGYPVFTRKASTDVSFLACAKKIFAHPEAFYPQLATHNAYSLAAVLEMSTLANNCERLDSRDRGIGRHKDVQGASNDCQGRQFEFQCLHGMGYTLYDQVVGADHLNIPCRVYAPVGGHKDLLAYLVRRLLENGANTSFVNRIIDEDVSIDDIIVDPVAKVRALTSKPHPQIPLPRDIYGAERKNSKGIDLTNHDELAMLDEELNKIVGQAIAKRLPDNNVRERFAHPDLQNVQNFSIEQLQQTLEIADKATAQWDTTTVAERAACLDHAADLFEQRMPEFMALLVREGGKTIPDAIGEVRETIDYCRYYAQQARKTLTPQIMPGPTGELNQLTLHGRGVIVCISPWNFPLAIFLGQVTAALVAGNTVLAKPADQTRQIAAAAVSVLHEAGIPKDVLHYIPARGSVIGNHLLNDIRVKGVVFTGSTETARAINQTLANRTGPIVPLIAETGGQNAMIIDSSALPEQAVMDVINSAFYSAGQRCSALRVLFVQEDVAPKIIEMLCGAMAELKLGEPGLLETDIGPVIDQNAKVALEEHVERMKREGKLLYQVNILANSGQDIYNFFAPCAFEINSLSQLTHEVFGPVLHVIRYRAQELDKVINDIHNTGYGLTLGIQSRIDATIDYINKRLHVGNVYVNRNMIGAVVGVQPFGGEGLSGTGPKAGGPHYLLRLCTERTLCVNTTAAGGNASLLCLGD